MGLMDFFHNRVEKTSKTVDSEENKELLEKEFISDISLTELDNVNWSEFGGRLKKNLILPNSYNKKPSKVQVKIDSNCRPMVLLTFDSSTTTSFKQFMLYQNQACGTISSGKLSELNRVWLEYVQEIRQRNIVKTNNLGDEHKKRGEKTMFKALKMLDMADLYQKEEEFIENLQGTEFCSFEYESLWLKNGKHTGYIRKPQFLPLVESDYAILYRSPVLPFSPKTLEYCITHMTDDAKVINGENLNDFEKKCREIQKYSCLESDDWDKVIEIGMQMCSEYYEESCQAMGL